MPAGHATRSRVPAQGSRRPGAARSRSRRPPRPGRRRRARPAHRRGGRAAALARGAARRRSRARRRRRACSPGSSPRSSSAVAWIGRARTAAPPTFAARAHVYVERLDDTITHRRATTATTSARVRRLRAGEVVTAADGHGRWRAVRRWTTSHGGRRVAARRPPTSRTSRRSRPRSRSRARSTKGERPELVVQKLTELGVDRIVLVRARALGRALGRDARGRALDRLRRVAREAGAQSRRARLPVVDGPVPVAELRRAPRARASPTTTASRRRRARRRRPTASGSWRSAPKAASTTTSCEALRRRPAPRRRRRSSCAPRPRRSPPPPRWPGAGRPTLRANARSRYRCS